MKLSIKDFFSKCDLIRSFLCSEYYFQSIFLIRSFVPVSDMGQQRQWTHIMNDSISIVEMRQIYFMQNVYLKITFFRF